MKNRHINCDTCRMFCALTIFVGLKSPKSSSILVLINIVLTIIAMIINYEKAATRTAIYEDTILDDL